jgi:hypothetical protein
VIRLLLALAAVVALPACSSKDVSLGDGRNGVSVKAGGSAAFDFQPPVLIAGLDPSDGGETTDDDPSPTGDLTLMLFDSKRAGGSGKEDIWETTRSSASASWESPRFVSALSSPERDTGIALTADGLTVYFSSDREKDDDGLDVFVSTRESRDGEWSEPKHVPEVESSDDDLVSAVDPSGEHLYLARRKNDDDDYDLYVATRAGDAWDAPAPISELNTDDEESDAYAAKGGLTLVFTRDENLWIAERASLEDPFGKPAKLDALNSEHDDRDAWTTPDLDVVVFSSNRTGDYRIYEARR